MSVARDCPICHGEGYTNPDDPFTCFDTCDDCSKRVCEACMVYHVERRGVCKTCEDSLDEALAEREYDDGSAPAECDR